MAPSAEPEMLDMLLVQVCRLHYLRAHALLEKTGLHRGQPPVLRALWEQEGLTHTELAERLQVTPATMTRMLQRMERAGFVERRPDPADQRLSRVYLTGAGRAVRAAVHEVVCTMEAETLAGFSPEERALLQRLLLAIRDNLLRAVDKDQRLSCR
ncbi:MAG: MarR family transcriptional regulator [Anaerolineae bacterium]|nr:MarR family transcriptional regulator [Anaerolineae bacterium]